jgi:hypothetical protein
MKVIKATVLTQVNAYLEHPPSSTDPEDDDNRIYYDAGSRSTIGITSILCRVRFSTLVHFMHISCFQFAGEIDSG